MSSNYEEKQLRFISSLESPVIVETKDNKVYVGYLVEVNTMNKWRVLPLSLRKRSCCFARSHIKRIIYLYNFLIEPKELHSKKELQFADIFEVNQLIQRAGYQII